MKQTDSKQFVISSYQSASIVASTIIGVGVLVLPRGVTLYAKQSGWFSIILGMVLSMVAMTIITVLSGRFPGESIVSYSAKILGTKKRSSVGKLLSLPLLLLYVAYWGIGTVIIARMFGEVVITTVLQETPLEIIIITMLITALVLTLYDVEVLARVNEILLPIIVVPVLVIALSSYKSAKLYNLFPFHEGADWGAFFMGALVSSFSYLGFEIMTLFHAHTEQQPSLLRANLAAIVLPGILYTLIVFSGIAVFGVEELSLLTWPTLELVKVTEVPGLILERMESAFLGVWVAAVFTSTGNLYYATSLLIRQILGLKGHRTVAFLLLPLFYWLSLLPQNIHLLFEYQNYVTYLGGILSMIVPALLLLIAFLRKKGQRSNPLTDNRNAVPRNEPDEGAAIS